MVYRWGYSDRGVLFGPYCPVYGIGALTFLVLVGIFVVLWNKKIKPRYTPEELAAR